MHTTFNQPRFSGIYPIRKDEVSSEELERVKQLLEKKNISYRCKDVPVSLENPTVADSYLFVNDTAGQHNTSAFKPSKKNLKTSGALALYREFMQHLLLPFAKIYNNTGIDDGKGKSQQSPAAPSSPVSQLQQAVQGLEISDATASKHAPDLLESYCKLISSFEKGGRFLSSLHEHTYDFLSKDRHASLPTEYELLVLGALKNPNGNVLARNILKNIFMEYDASHAYYTDSVEGAEDARETEKAELTFKNDRNALFQSAQSVIAILPLDVLEPFKNGKLRSIHRKAEQFPDWRQLQQQIDERVQSLSSK